MSPLKLTHLTFFGTNVERVSVEFGPVANVVRGPSDTGKSFIVDALDYMLGARTLKDIIEMEGYSTVLLGLLLPSGEPVTLSRSLGRQKIGLHLRDVRSEPLEPPAQTLNSTHSANDNANLSSYLLAQIGLSDKRVRVNALNATRPLSFRDIAHLCVVDETRMQSEVAPALSGHRTSKTAELSTLKLLLQGQDDGEIVEVQSPSDRRQITRAKSEVLDQLLAQTEVRLSSAKDPVEVRTQLARLNETIGQHSGTIESLINERGALAFRLADIERQIVEQRQRHGEIDELTSRFGLLSAKYASDLARLEMIAEAGALLGFFQPGVCVFCGAEPDHQHLNDHVATDSTHFRESISAEQRKTALLSTDLLDAIGDLEGERAELTALESGLQHSANGVRDTIRSIETQLAPQQVELRTLLGLRSVLDRQLADFEQLETLNAMKSAIVVAGQPESAEEPQGLQAGALAELSRLIAQRLTNWGVPDGDRARFDRNEQDLILGEQRRSAHGKGVRAILHAAFTISLAEFCVSRGLPHPGFVVLDSPLVTYRPPDPGETVDPDDVLDPSVAGKFYADIQRNFGVQILVMENTEPPDDMGGDSFDVPFTKLPGQGRYGFFPHPIEG